MYAGSYVLPARKHYSHPRGTVPDSRGGGASAPHLPHLGVPGGQSLPGHGRSPWIGSGARRSSHSRPSVSDRQARKGRLTRAGAARAATTPAASAAGANAERPRLNAASGAPPRAQRDGRAATNPGRQGTRPAAHRASRRQTGARTTGRERGKILSPTQWHRRCTDLRYAQHMAYNRVKVPC